MKSTNMPEPYRSISALKSAGRRVPSDASTRPHSPFASTGSAGGGTSATRSSIADTSAIVTGWTHVSTWRGRHEGCHGQTRRSRFHPHCREARPRASDFADDRSYPRGVTYEAAERVLDRLIQALAAQLDPSANAALTPGAVEALTGLSRAEANLIFGVAGHLVHYDADTEPIEVLVKLISDIQRGEAAADAAVVSGDQVRLVGELPAGLAAKYDATWLRETVFVVRYVGDDATVDVQPDLIQDYFIEAVPIATVKSARTQSTP